MKIIGYRGRTLAPYQAYDDGTFTYLSFAAHRDFPAVYYLTEQNGEALVNTHVAGDTIVVHRVAQKLILRKGKMVACIFNQSFDANGIKNPTETVSPAVERTIKGEK